MATPLILICVLASGFKLVGYSSCSTREVECFGQSPYGIKGDCCECTCVGGQYSRNSDFFCIGVQYSCNSGFSCIDPTSGCIDPMAAEYPNCTGYISKMGDGRCDEANNNYLCGYDQGDCCECSCIDGPDFSCGIDGFYCIDPTSGCVDPIFADYPNCTGYVSNMGDGYCDEYNNNEMCGYDLGDCCECTCAGGQYSCSVDTFVCIDPTSGCVDPNAVEYINCAGMVSSSLGDGFCDQDFNNELCGYDLGDCCQCTSVDGADNSFGYFSCIDPTSECIDPIAAEYPNCTGDISDMGNGYCYEDNNNELCGYDLGDCCECTCTDGQYNCSSSSFICVDPKSNCLDQRIVDNPNCSTYKDDFFFSAIGDGECDRALNNPDCGFDGGDCCLCTMIDNLYFGIEVSPLLIWPMDTELLDCLDPDAAPREVLYECDTAPTSPRPCLDDHEGPLVVESPADVNLVAETVYCTGGEFEVEWRSHIVVDQAIVVPDGTVLNVTGVGSNATIDGGGISRLFTVLDASLHVADITIGNGSSVSGGAIYATSSTLTFHRTSFVGNTAFTNGGALLVSNGSNACFHDTSFSANTAHTNGGALCLTNDSRASWAGRTRFNDNIATCSGGAVDVSNGSNASWAGMAIFSGNLANVGNGGVVNVASGTLSWAGETNFTGNIARYGGAVSLLSESNALWTGSTIAHNNSAVYGGAMYVGNNSNALWGGTNVAFSANRAQGRTFIQTANRASSSIGGFGGAVHVAAYGNGMFTTETSFRSNVAENDGGALYVANGEVSWVAKTTYLNSTPISEDGGSLCPTRQGKCFPPTKTIFHSNVASDNGGALYVSSGEVSWGADVLFFNNTAESGGALLVTDGSIVKWSGDTNFTSNTAHSDGGALGSTPFYQSKIFCGDKNSFTTSAEIESVFILERTTNFVNNVAEANGGGMALSATLSIVFDTADVRFYGNVASVAGGAVFISATRIGPTFNGTRFDSNSAQVGGGVFSTGSGTTVTKDGYTNKVHYYPRKFIGCTFVNNLAHATGGAVNTASGKDDFVDTLFLRNSARVGGALRLAGEVSLENCSFVENISDSDGGAAVSNIGFISDFSNIYFSGNKFRCEVQSIFNLTESQPGELHDKVCDGCPTNCTCAFEEPDLAPQCISLAEAGIENANSSGGLSTVEDLYIFEGYWRATNTSTNVKKCYNPAACPGGLTTGSCNTGYKGPYCAVCGEDYVSSLGFTCNKCSGNKKGIVMASVFAAASVAVVVTVVWYLMSSEANGKGQGVVDRITRRVPIQAIKIIIVAWQITTQFASVANVTFPNVYQRFLDGVNVLNFDLSWVVSPGCFMGYNFYDRLLTTTIGPVVAAGLLGVTYAIAASRNRASETALQAVRQKHASVVLLMIFFVYSNVSSVVFQTFSCDSLDDGKSYLRADYSIECYNKEHIAYRVYASVMIFVYPIGIPVLFAGLLFRNRHVLQDENSSKEDLMVKSTENLWKPYKPSRFYYEVIECIRRIMLTGVVVFIYPDSAAQIAVTLAVAAVFAMAAEALAPYDSQWDTWISRAGHALVATSVYLTLLLKVDVSDEESRSQKMFEIILVAAHGCMILAAAAEALAMVCALREIRQHPAPIMPTAHHQWNRKASLIDVDSPNDTSISVCRGDDDDAE